jgi:foldase protein PrsA
VDVHKNKEWIKKEKQERKGGIFMRKIARTMVVVFVLTVILTGCSIQLGNTEYHFTTGLSSDEVFRIGDEVCTVQEARVIMSAQKKLIEDAYGDSIWNVSAQDSSFSEYVQDSLRDFLTKLKVVKKMAADSNITISNEELSKLQECATEYMNALTDEEKDWLGVTQEEVQQLYEEYYLYNEIVDLMTENEQTEISDSEARIIQVQMITLSKTSQDENQNEVALSDEELQKLQKTAKSIVSQAKNGADFEDLAKKYSDSDTIEQSIARGIYGDAFDEIAFQLSDDEISSVIETDTAYYVLKCISSYDEKATQEHKQEMQNTQKNELFSSQYQEFVQDLDTELNNTAWKNLAIEDIMSISGADFFGIYEEKIANQ